MGDGLVSGEIEGVVRRLAAGVPGSAADEHTRSRLTYLLDALFDDLLTMTAPVLFVEAGAFEADASLRVAATLPLCRVVAFEANPYVYRRFSASTDFAAARVEYRHQALSDRQGETSFFIVASSASGCDDRQQGYNSLIKRTGGDWLGEVEYEEVGVMTTTLDAEFGDVRGACALWLDAEGGSGLVLSGGGLFLDRCDVVKAEVEAKAFWTGQWLVADVLAEMARHGLEPVARDVQYEEQYNVVFASRRLLSRPGVRARLAQHHDQARSVLQRSEQVPARPERR